MELLKIAAEPGAEVALTVSEEAPQWLTLWIDGHDGDPMKGADLTPKQAATLRDALTAWLESR